MDLKDLDLILALSRTGSFTATSKRMHITQPAVSQRLARLQERLGITLFERREGQIRATPAGQRLCQTADRISQELDSAKQHIEGLINHRRSHLRITTECYTCYRWLPFVLRDLRLQHPDLQVDVVPEATDAPAQALENDEIDIAIISRHANATRTDAKRLFADELFAVLSDDHPLANERWLLPKQFADQTLIVYSGSEHAILTEVLDPAGIAPARLMEVRITEAIVELARSGQGIAILSGWAYHDLDNREGLKALRITQKGFKRAWMAAVNPKTDAHHANAFVSSVQRIGAMINQQHWRRQLQKEI